MLMKSFTAGVIGSALLASAAFAQTPSTTDSTTTTPPPAATSTPPAASSSTTSTSSNTAATNSSYQGTWRTSKVVGLNVYNDGNESLGNINDLLTDKSGKIVAVIVGVGGFLGVGERNVAIPFEKVKFVNEPVASNTASSGGSMSKSTSSSTSGSTSTGTTGSAGGMTTTPSTTTSASAPNPWYPDHAVISGTKDELKAMPEFKFNNS